MKKLVSNQISPNLNLADAWFAVKQLRHLTKSPSKQKTASVPLSKGESKGDKKSADFHPLSSSRTRESFSVQFGTDNYLLTNSARTALGLIIDQVKPNQTKKVGLPAFICAVVATPFLTAGYEVVWIDTDENGLIDFDDFTEKSADFSVLVCPYIFGQTIDLQKFHTVCQQKNITLIEDCAHHQTVGPVKNSDFRIISFGREKVYSCVSGGALLWNRANKKSADFFASLQLPESSNKFVITHLLQPLIFNLALPWWQAGGKLIPYLWRRLNLLPLAVTKAEKTGQEDFPRASLAVPFQQLLKRQFHRADKINTHRQQLAQTWQPVLKKLFPTSEIIIPDNALRVILKTNHADKIKKSAEKIGFHLRDWDGVPISPAGVDLQKFGYPPGQCPTAETFASNYVTFPTNIQTMVKDIEFFAKNFKK